MAHFLRPNGGSPSSTSSVPPSSFTRRGSHGAGGSRANQLSVAEKNARRVSRTEMDFEQALRTGGTVVLEEGRRLESLGRSDSRSIPSTPTVVPPTPTPRLQRPGTAGSILSQTDSQTLAMFAAFNNEDIDLQMNRRSMFRSAGTSSSPDLATLLMKAKQRGGGVVGSSSNTTTDDDSSVDTASASHQTPVPETSVSASPSGQKQHLHPEPSSSTSAERSRTRTRSSSSSSYSMVSSTVSIPESPPSKSGLGRAGGTKAEKILGMAGVPIGSADGFSPIKNHAKESKTLRSAVRNKTSALWTRMTGQGGTRERSGSATYTSSGTSNPNTPLTPSYPHNFSTFAGGPSNNVSPTTPKLSVSPAPPVPPIPSNYRTRPSANDVFMTPSSADLSKPLPPIYNSKPHPQSRKEIVSSDDEVDLGQALQLAPPRPPNKMKPKSPQLHNRRRSLSVGDVVIDIRANGRYSLDQRQEEAGVSPNRQQQQQPNIPAPESAPPSAFPTSEKNMLEGWDLPSTGGGFRGAFDGYTVLSPQQDTFGSVSPRPTRGRSHTTTAPVPLAFASVLQQQQQYDPTNADELDLSRRPSIASIASASTADSSNGSHIPTDFRPLGPATTYQKRMANNRPPHQRHHAHLSISSDRTATQCTSRGASVESFGLVSPGTETDSMADVSTPSSAQPNSAGTSATSMGFPSRGTSIRTRSGSNPTSLRGGPYPLPGRGSEPAFKFTSPSYESLTLKKTRSGGRSVGGAGRNEGGVIVRKASGSDDTNASAGSSAVMVESPVQGRVVRLGSLPNSTPTVPGHILQQMRMGAAMSSVDVSSGGVIGGNGAGTVVDEEVLEEKGREAAEKCWNEDESFKQREKIAEYLGGVAKLKSIALKYYMDRFDFTGLRLDNAFRHLCGKLYLRAETQQVDRILVEFSRRYFECNPSSVYGSASVVHSTSYSLLLLNTDLHVAELSSRMSRNQFIRNTMNAISDSVRGPRNGGLEAGRASTPELMSTSAILDDVSGGRASADVEGTVKIKSKRSGSLHSWKSASREAFPGVVTGLGNGSTPQLVGAGAENGKGSGNTPSGTPTTTLGKSSGSGVYGRSWESDMEAVLKEMYNAIKSQQILQPSFAAERPSTSSSLSPTPHNTVLTRRGSQRGPPDRLKRGSIRGISTLLGSQQSPYSSNSSVDGRVSPSPSFATSIGEGVSTSTSSLFTPTLGFASNLSHTIIKEAQEDDLGSVASVDSDDSAVSITDEELALLGPPWAKEGMLCRKQYWETTGKRAKNKTWMDVFVVIQKGELSMFTFGDGDGVSGGGQVGGGNWLSNAHSVGTVQLAHSLAHSLPPPGYNRSRPHCFVLTLASDSVYFFQAGTEDLVNEWVSTCNYWAARLSKEPLSGGVSNMEYGWNRVTDMFGSNPAVNTMQDNGADDYNDAFSVRSGKSRLSKRSWTDTQGRGNIQYSPFAMDKIYINDWKPPMTSTVPSTHDEETQMEALQRQAIILKNDLAEHDKIQIPMRNLYPPRSANAVKASTNWEQKKKFLMAEIFKYDTYVDSLQDAMNLRLKKRGERVLEKTLVDGIAPDDDTYLAPPNTAGRNGGRGLQQETIQEAEEPSTPGLNGAGVFGSHRREVAGIDRDDR